MPGLKYLIFFISNEEIRIRWIAENFKKISDEDFLNGDNSILFLIFCEIFLKKFIFN
jgi:hypothetical protein